MILKACQKYLPKSSLEPLAHKQKNEKDNDDGEGGAQYSEPLGVLLEEGRKNSEPQVQMSYDRLALWNHSRPEGGIDWSVHYPVSFVK
jgi:hypothetical protein